MRLSIVALCFITITGLLLGCSSQSYNRDADGNRLTASGESLVCEKVEVTGTRFAKEVCRTEAEWDDVKKNQRAVADEYGRQTRENSALMPPGDESPYGSP